MTSMRVWQATGRGLSGLALSTAGRPEPGPGEALVRTEWAALNFSDLLMLDDAYQVRPPRPFVPGQEIAGEVAALGPGCPLAVGDRIASKLLWGGFADYAVVRADMALPVPEHLPLATAVVLPVSYTTAAVALTESTALRRDETVLVLAAAGGVGLAAVEIAAALGARVIGAAGGEAKCALAREHGAAEAVDYRSPNWPERVKAVTGGRGVDVVFDPVGGDESEAALRLLAPGGRFLIVGFASGRIPKIPANRLLLKRASAIGVYWNHDTDGKMIARANGRLCELLRGGAIRPHVGARYVFEELPQALADLSSRRTAGKSILAVGATS